MITSGWKGSNEMMCYEIENCMYTYIIFAAKNAKNEFIPKKCSVRCAFHEWAPCQAHCNYNNHFANVNFSGRLRFTVCLVTHTACGYIYTHVFTIILDVCVQCTFTVLYSWKTHVHPLFNAFIWRRYHFGCEAGTAAGVAFCYFTFWKWNAIKWISS